MNFNLSINQEFQDIDIYCNDYERLKHFMNYLLDDSSSIDLINIVEANYCIGLGSRILTGILGGLVIDDLSVFEYQPIYQSIVYKNFTLFTNIESEIKSVIELEISKIPQTNRIVIFWSIR